MGHLTPFIRLYKVDINPQTEFKRIICLINKNFICINRESNPGLILGRDVFYH